MSHDWLLIGITAAPVVACVIAFLLGACWQAGRADEQSDELIERLEMDRVVRHGEQHPWIPQ